MNTDEKILIDRICQGQLDAFQELVEQYKKKIYYLAFDMSGDHHEAEDISQEVFIKVFRSIKKFRKDSSLCTWLYQVTVNTCIDAHRKKSRRPQVLMESAQMERFQQASSLTGTGISNPERSTEANMLQHQVREILHKFSPKERSAFVMRYFNEFKTGEIAKILNDSTNTIKSLLFRAKKKLRKELALYQAGPAAEVVDD